MELKLTNPRNDRSRSYSLRSGHSIGQRRRRWSGRDEQRTVVKRNSYAPFGETYAPAVIDGTGYTGHVMDQATGLTYMQQRYYDPQIGRFLSIDPAPADPSSGTNYNSYWYGNNNPYRFTDPDGRVAQSGDSKPPPNSEPKPEPKPPCDEGCMRMRAKSDSLGPAGSGGSLVAQVIDALISTLAPRTANENKRQNHPTKLPDEAAARLSVTNGTALLIATGGQVALPAAVGVGEGGASAYGTAGLLTQRALMSPGGQRIAMGGCVAFSVCMQGKTGEDPGQYVQDRQRSAQTYEGMMLELRTMYQAAQH